MAEPRYPHHCPDCVFVGASGDTDLYLCHHHVNESGRELFLGSGGTFVVSRRNHRSYSYRHSTWAACPKRGERVPFSTALHGIRLACAAGLLRKDHADSALNGDALDD